MATVSGINKLSDPGTTPGYMKHEGMLSPFVHTGLMNGVTYYFVVTAVGPGGESGESPQVFATPQAAPIQVKVGTGSGEVSKEVVVPVTVGNVGSSDPDNVTGKGIIGTKFHIGFDDTRLDFQRLSLGKDFFRKTHPCSPSRKHRNTTTAPCRFSGVSGNSKENTCVVTRNVVS
jgi:hypothetical protein